jgi:hypothetical protein
MGNDERFISISESNWEVVTTSPVLFKLHKNQLQQVEPSNEQIDLKELFRFINVSDHYDQLLILVYLICAFIPNIPRPILSAHGSQGSAKTTGLKIIRELIDPSEPAIVSPPKDAKEFVQLASHNYVLLLDNLSFLTETQSDALSRFVTGDGYAKRSLFTDDDDFLYSFRRVVGLSGINQIATKPDLLSRCLIIKFERIAPEKRVTENALWKEFKLLKPKFFGALLTAVSKTLANINESETKFVRLADFHQYASAAADALGFSQSDLDFALSKNTDRQNEESLESSGVAKAIMRFMEGKDYFSGSSSLLYQELAEIAKNEFSKSNFPNGSNWLWKKIELVLPNLIEVGITCEHDTTKPAHSIIHISNSGSHIPNKPEQFVGDDPKVVLDSVDLFEPDASGGMEAFEARKEVV